MKLLSLSQFYAPIFKTKGKLLTLKEWQLYFAKQKHLHLVSCNATGTISTTSGFISSPNHPNNYDNNHHCKWIINAAGVSATMILFLNDSMY